jgi:HlyD family secretion protein
MQKNRRPWVKRGLAAAVGIALIGALFWALRPQPIPVDTEKVLRANFLETVDEEGKTRIRDVFVVAAPFAGTVRRSPVKVGDRVVKDETVVAVIDPPAPTIRDVRTSLELETQVKTCEAAVKLANAELRQAQAELNFAEGELERTQTLARKGIAAGRTLERAEADQKQRQAAVARAEANILLRKSELDGAKARLLGPGEAAARTGASGTCSLEVKAPVSGNVLKLIAESEQTLAIGAALLEVGNPSDLEIVVELLSGDAVKVKPGANATIESWGGPPLVARVTRIEPSGFTKISALGIEEQRVKTILALQGQPKDWERLGHDYRVFARIEVFQAADALVVPLGALFRHGADWRVFTVKDSSAQVRDVSIGQRNNSAAHVHSGLVEGDEIILHPSDRVADGVRIQVRPKDK